MSAEDVKKCVIDRMKNHMMPPKTCTEKNLRDIMADYITALSAYDQAVLDGAWQIIISRWKGSTWPKVAHWVEACKEAQTKVKFLNSEKIMTPAEHRNAARDYVSQRTRDLVNNIVNSNDEYMHIVQMAIRVGEYYDLETDLIIVAGNYLSYEYFSKNGVTKYASKTPRDNTCFPVTNWDDDLLMAWGSDLWTKSPFETAFDRCKPEHIEEQE